MNTIYMQMVFIRVYPRSSASYFFIECRNPC
jgi:hypothetical protein